MNKVQGTHIRPLSAPDFPRQLARKLAVVTTLLCATMHFAFWRLGQIEASFGVEPPDLLVALLAAVLLGYGIAALGALLWVNRARLGPVLRPSWGKLLGAVLLMLVLPLAVFSWIPWILGGFAIVMLAMPDGGSVIASVLVAAGIATLAWYPVSALIVSGTRSHWLRFGLFCIMFWSCYAAHILYTGTQVFTI